MGCLTHAMIDTLLSTPPAPVLEKVPCPELGEDVHAYVKMLNCAEAELIERIAGQNANQQLDALYVTGNIVCPPDAEATKMTVAEAQAILDDPPTVRLPLVEATLCDEIGACLITDDEQRQWLRTLPPSLIRRLHDATWKLNSTGDEKVIAAVKNFARPQTSDSGIAWHVNGAVQSGPVSND